LELAGLVIDEAGLDDYAAEGTPVIGDEVGDDHFFDDVGGAKRVLDLGFEGIEGFAGLGLEDEEGVESGWWVGRFHRGSCA
jgi:hypothetical protein